MPFFSISGSDFVEMFVGVGASRVRDMFEQAKKNAPCIIFIDEIDAVGRHRGAGLGGGNDEREQTLNQLLVEMDGFESNEGVILIAATNRPDVLDPALLRPGRFDRQVVVPNPDVGGREKILKVHMRKVPLAPDVDPRVLARGTPGFSGADLANLVNEAALLAARVGKRLVTMADFEYAKDKVLMGTERRSMAMTDEEKKLTAYHEAGHALVAMHVPKSDPLHKVTIIPRGRALGVTMQLPERDHLSHTKQFLESRLAIMFGGRIAEEIIFGPENVTTGAASDIQVATQTARGMVTAFGMSDKLGRVRYQANEQEVFLGHAVTQTQNVSEATAQLIDQEVRRLIEEAEGKAKQILTDHLDDLHLIAKALLEYETLSNDEIGQVLRGEKIVRDDTGGAGSGADRRRRASVPTSSGQGTGPAPRRQSRAAAGRLIGELSPAFRSIARQGDGDRECDAGFLFRRRRTPRPSAGHRRWPAFRFGGRRHRRCRRRVDAARLAADRRRRGAAAASCRSSRGWPSAASSSRSTPAAPRWRAPASMPARASSTTSRRCADDPGLLPLVVAARRAGRADAPPRPAGGQVRRVRPIATSSRTCADFLLERAAGLPRQPASRATASPSIPASASARASRRTWR